LLANYVTSTMVMMSSLWQQLDSSAVCYLHSFLK
jgi:hypothetical protein